MSQPCLPVSRRRKRGRQDEETTTTSENDATGFDDIESMDAAEYLSRVVKQAKGMPEICVASAETIDKNQIPSKVRDHVPIDGSAASLSYLISGRASLTAVPSAEHLPRRNNNPNVWIDSTISNFEKLRTYMETCRAKGIGGKKTERTPLPPMKDRSGWHIFCVGNDEARGNVNSYFGEDDDDNEEEENDSKVSEEEEIPEWQKGIPDKGHSPSVRLLLQMDQVLVRRVLSHLSYYIREGWSPLTPQRSAWIYALLARLEKPVHRDDAAILFGLLKMFTKARSKLKPVDDERSKLAKLNALIVLIGIYFEQGRDSMTHNKT
jgi:survival of motor neuron protein-interacting protein 1